MSRDKEKRMKMKFEGSCPGRRKEEKDSREGKKKGQRNSERRRKRRKEKRLRN